MPAEGFKSVTIREEDYEFFKELYEVEKLNLRKEGITSFSGFITKKLFESIKIDQPEHNILYYVDLYIKNLDKHPLFDNEEMFAIASKLMKHSLPSRRPSNVGNKAMNILSKLSEPYNLIKTYMIQQLDKLWLVNLFIDGDKIITEPYVMGIESMKNLIKFCEDNKLIPIITGQSWQYPGHALRIEIYDEPIDKLTPQEMVELLNRPPF